MMKDKIESGEARAEQRAGGSAMSRRNFLALAGGGSLALLVPSLPAIAAPEGSVQADLEAYAQYLRSTKGILDIRTFHRSGAGPNFLDVVVVSAGFTPEQMGDFHGVCERFTKALLSRQPWERYRSVVNVLAVFVGDEGVESSRLRVSGYNGGVVGCDQGLAAEYARYAANAAATVVIHNSTHSRGGTGTWGVVTINKASASTPMVPIHELGHGLAGLGDEYIQMSKPFDGDPKSLDHTVNVTAEPNPRLCKWHYWTEEEWPGLFVPSKRPAGTNVANVEGAGWPKGIYRPEKGCFMRCNREAFCVVCNETLESSFFRNIDLFQVVEPATEDVVLWKGEQVDVRVSAIDMLHRPPEWLRSRLSLYLDGDQVASSDRGEVSFRLSGRTSQPGIHQLGANLSIQSEGVRRDFGFLSGSRGWRIRIIPWARPSLALTRQVSVPSDGAVDVPVAIRHENPALFDLRMAHAPAGAVLEAGRFRWKPAGATGSWRVDFTVSHEGRPALTESLEIQVTRGGSTEAAPEVQPLDPIDAVTGKQTVLQLKAQARDGGHLLFEPIHAPAGIELNRYTGELSWIPLVGQAGPLRMRFRVHNGQAAREIDLLFRVRRAATPAPVSYANRYIPQTLEALKQLQQNPVVYRRLFETLRLLRDRYEPIWQKALAEAKGLYKELPPKLRNNGLRELHLHAWEWAARPDILKWMREVAGDEKSDEARILLGRLNEIDRYNAGRIRAQ